MVSWTGVTMGTDVHVVAEVRKDGVWHLADVVVPDDRNYWTFAILANVRNDFGFSGVHTGKAVRPIAEPRGLPDDLSEGARRKRGADIDNEESCLCYGDHSFSYVTLQELLAYDLERDVVQSGVVPNQVAELFRATGEKPKEWCGGRSPMDGFERIEWGRPLKEAAWLLPQMIEAIKPLGSPEDVRLVFCFDN